MEHRRRFELAENRPADVPQGWTIFNAPRPLWGHKEWQGKFGAGIFYAAVDPQGERADWMIAENRSLKACVVEYVSREAVLDWARKRGESLEKPDLAERIPFNALFQSYAEHHSKSEH